MAQNDLPAGWEVVNDSPASALPAGWEVVDGHQPPEKSLAGFGSNILTSGVNFGKGMIDGMKQLVILSNRVGNAMTSPQEAQRLAQDMKALIQKTPELADALGHALKDRYGSVDAVKNTLYTDPVGVLGDIATVAGTVATGGAMGETALAARAPQLASTMGRAGRTAGMIERVTNPISAVTAPLKVLSRESGLGIVQGTVRPSKAMRDAAGGGREIAKTIVDEGLMTGKQASAATTQSREAVDALLAAKDAERPVVRGYLPPGQEAIPMGPTPVPGQMPVQVTRPQEMPLRRPPVSPLTGSRYAEHIPGVDPVESVTSSFLDHTGHPITPVPDAPPLSGPGVMMRDMPSKAGPGAPPNMVDPRDIVKPLNDVRSNVGNRALGTEDVSQIDDLQKRFLDQHSRPMNYTETNALKRAEQDLADRAYRSEAAGHPINANEMQFHKGVARGAREAIETGVPAAGPINARTQRLGGAEEALTAAEDRTHGLTNPLAVAAGIASGAATANPLVGIATGLGTRALDSSRVGTALGIGLDRTGKLVDAKAMRRLMLLARLAEREQQ